MTKLSAPKFAIVTPSYKPDFERCRLLSQSIQTCIRDQTKHYIIVDRQDLSLFQQLASPRTEILVVEDLLPWWIFRVPVFQKAWMSLKTLPIRNWVLQQLVKMAAVEAIAEDVLIFCDSDVTFIRPFDTSYFVKDDQVALLRVNYQDKDIQKWTASSKQMLGLESQVFPTFNYVSNLITWRRDNILKLQRHLEVVNHTHWMKAVCNHWHISEYMIYGVFVAQVLGMGQAGHFPFDVDLLHTSWSSPLNSEQAVDQFLSQINESHIGVMIHSKQGIPVSLYQQKLEAYWYQLC